MQFGMNYPRGIAVNHANGDVWLSNTRQGNVKVYNQNGNFIRQFGTFGSGNSQFRYARGLWVSDNRMWSADSGNLRVKATNLFGSTQVTQDCGADYSDLSHEGCTDAVRGLDGRLYVAAPSDNQIYVYNYTNGNLITTFGASQLRGPVGIAQTPDETLWITELDTNRVSAYSTAGEFLGTFGSFGSGNNQFNQPTGIAADTNGNIYVADRLNERIQVFSTTGGGGGPDTTPPNGTVDVPTPNQVFGAGTITFEGDATDNVGVDQVRVAIRNVDTQQWWTGTGWGGWTTFPADLGSPGAGATTWSYDWAPPGSGQYALWIRADDTSGNQDPTKPWVRFSTTGGGGGPDTTPPNGTVDVPTPNQVFGAGTITFEGDATDNVGVDQVRVAIRNVDTQQWWTGTGWGGWTTFPADLGSPGAGATTWSYDWAPPGSGQYALWIRADDTSGNQDPTKPWVRFSRN